MPVRILAPGAVSGPASSRTPRIAPLNGWLAASPSRGMATAMRAIMHPCPWRASTLGPPLGGVRPNLRCPGGLSFAALRRSSWFATSRDGERAASHPTASPKSGSSTRLTSPPLSKSLRKIRVSNGEVPAMATSTMRLIKCEALRWADCESIMPGGGALCRTATPSAVRPWPFAKWTAPSVCHPAPGL